MGSIKIVVSVYTFLKNYLNMKKKTYKSLVNIEVYNNISMQF